MLKKFTAMLITLIMVIGMMVPAYGAAFTDISGHKSEQAVVTLKNLGVLVGRDDGTVGPNDNVTRAEMATILVKLAGYANEIPAADNDVAAFSDTADHWGKGEINVAFQHGLIVGVGDGKFNPDASVTYGEVLTMVMKLLGYGPVVDNTGIWPYNYMNKASQSGIELTKNVAASAFAPATRGDIAIIAYNALTANTLVENGYNSDGKPTYAIGSDPEDKLLSRVFDAREFENVVVTNVPVLDSNPNNVNQITLVDKKTLAPVGSDDFGSDRNIGTWEVSEGIVEDINDLLFMEVSGIFKENKEENVNEILSIVVDTKSSRVIRDTIKDVTIDGSGNLTEIEFTKAGKKLANVDAIYLNYTDFTSDISGFKDAVTDIDLASVVAVLDSDGLKVKYINAFVDNTIGDTIISSVIKEKTSSSYNFVVGSSINFSNYKKGIAAKDVKAIVIRDGVNVNIDELAAGDYVTVITKGSATVVAGDGYVYPSIYVIAYSKPAITNKILSGISGTTRATAMLVIDGVKYPLASNAVINGGTSSGIKDNAKAIANDNDLDNLRDFISEPVNVVMNNVGEVVYVESVNMIAASSTQRALVVNVETEKGEKLVTILTADGSFDTYTADDKNAAWAKDALVEYKITRNGKIEFVKNLSSTSGYKVDTTKNLFYKGSTQYAITNSTVIFNRKATVDVNAGIDYEDAYEVIKWENVKNAVGVIVDGNLPEGSMYRQSNGTVTHLFINYGSQLSEGSDSALVVENGINTDGVYVKLLVGNAVREYKLVGGANYAINGHYVKFTASGNSVTLDSNGVDEYYYENVYRAYTNAEDDIITARKLQLNAAGNGVSETGYFPLVFNANTKAYDATDKDAVKKISVSDIKKNDYFYAEMDAEGFVKVIIRISKNDIHLAEDLSNN